MQQNMNSSLAIFGQFSMAISLLISPALTILTGKHFAGVDKSYCSHLGYTYVVNTRTVNTLIEQSIL